MLPSGEYLFSVPSLIIDAFNVASTYRSSDYIVARLCVTVLPEPRISSSSAEPENHCGWASTVAITTELAINSEQNTILRNKRR
jgi:hypothetical protein